MLQLGAAARRIGRLIAALAALAALAACGSVTSGAGRASTERSPSALAGPAPSAGAASQARTGSPSSPPPASPAAANAVKHFDFLNGVSCASPANCTAVGQYYRTASGPQLTLIERWNGRAWRVEPSPSIGRGSTLDSVSCPSATSCTAVGSLIIGWNGVSWKVELRSSPFVSVSCAAPARAWPSASRPAARRSPGTSMARAGSWSRCPGRRTRRRTSPWPRSPAPGRASAWRSGTTPTGSAPCPARQPGTRPSPNAGTGRPGGSSPRSTWRAGTSSPRSRAHRRARAPRSAAARRQVRARRALGRLGVDDPARTRREPDRLHPADRRVVQLGQRLHGGRHLQRGNHRYRRIVEWRRVDAAPDARPAAAAAIRPAGQSVVHRARRMRRGRKRRPHARRDLGRRALADHTHPQSVARPGSQAPERLRSPAGRLRRARPHLGSAPR